MNVKKLNFFCYKYNSTLNTNCLYFTISTSYLFFIKFFYNEGLINFYTITNGIIYVYLPKNSKKSIKIKIFNNKHKKIFHGKNKVTAFNWYLSSVGFIFGRKLQKLKLGGQLLYSY
jgi:hypothetical protein